MEEVLRQCMSHPAPTLLSKTLMPREVTCVKSEVHIGLDAVLG